jgi:hypothetical protein
MAKDWGYIGGQYLHESGAIDVQDTKNFYPEAVESGSGKSVKSLMGIPGLASFCTLPTAPVRQLFEQDGRMWAVGGTVLYEVFAGATYLLRGGALIDDGKPATIDSNGAAGHQLWVTAGRRGGVYDLTANTWTPDVRVDADSGAFVDSFFLSLDRATSTVYVSDAENGLVWNALAKAQRNIASDALVAMGVNSRLVWLLGSKTSEVWYNSGASPMPLVPFQGGFLEVGCASAASVAWCDNSIMWLGQSEGGPATVWRNSGFQAQRISTHALAAQIAGYGATAQASARAFVYTDRDHAFYVLSFPTVNQTHVYDAATGLWADRGYWNTSTGLWEVYKPQFHCYAFGKHLVGDGVTGAIYELSPTTYTDAGGVPLRALRQGPYVVDQQQRLYHRDFWLDVETGVGNANCLSPQVMCSRTDDKGKTWPAFADKAIGAQGDVNTRVEWKRLGSAKQRAYRTVITDPVPRRIADAYLEIDKGGGQ